MENNENKKSGTEFPYRLGLVYPFPVSLVLSSSLMDSDSPHSDMATPLVLPQNNQQQQQNGGVNRRYRPAPAKTFQCRGYGDCRMVFSRSEHLARHIRFVFLALPPPRPSVPGSLPLPSGNTPANVLSLVIVANSSLASTIFVNMLKPFTPINRMPMSA
jgi:hypothetical protein